jgi:adenosine deaminase
MAMTHNLPVAGVVEAVIEGVREGCKAFDVQARLIGIMSRTFGEAACLQELEALLAHRDQITAVDLAGDELGFPGSLFLSHFNRARDAGWHITVHAGKRLVRKASGRLSASWAPSVLVTALKPLKIAP